MPRPDHNPNHNVERHPPRFDPPTPWRNARGVTLLEMLITVTLILVLASVALPLSRLSEKRQKESVLRATLIEMRNAIDAFKADWDAKRISTVESDADIVNVNTGYPASLQALVEGAPLANSPNKKRIKYLRRIPMDPITRSTEWGTRCYKDGPDVLISCGEDVYDVFTRDDQTGLNGVPYREW